jgi:toxin ParE1/3/4
MKLEFSNHALADLREISAHSRQQFGARVARALEIRIRNVVDNVARRPESGPRIEQRADLRVVALGRYPFKIFYRVRSDSVRILHIRHTARRPWIPAD